MLSTKIIMLCRQQITKKGFGRAGVVAQDGGRVGVAAGVGDGLGIMDITTHMDITRITIINPKTNNTLSH
jgi:hypothetical protein